MAKLLISARVVLADLFGHVGEVEFDRPTATRLECGQIPCVRQPASLRCITEIVPA